MGSRYAVRSARCGMSRTNLLLARRHASLSRSNPFRCGIPMSIISLQSVNKEGTLITIVTEPQLTVKRQHYILLGNFWEPSLMPADMTKSSATLKKRVVQKPAEIGLNPPNYTQGGFERPKCKQKSRLTTMWIWALDFFHATKVQNETSSIHTTQTGRKETNLLVCSASCESSIQGTLPSCMAGEASRGTPHGWQESSSNP